MYSVVKPDRIVWCVCVGLVCRPPAGSNRHRRAWWVCRADWKVVEGGEGLGREVEFGMCWVAVGKVGGQNEDMV